MAQLLSTWRTATFLTALFLFPAWSGPALAQESDLSDRPREPNREPAPNLNLVDEPGLAPAEDDPRGKLAARRYAPPGVVRSPAVALLLPLTLTIVPMVAGARCSAFGQAVSR